MFSIVIDNEAVIMHGNASKLIVWPGCGAILNQWSVQTANGVEELIDGYADAEDFAANAEIKGFRSCKLSPYVCRMAPGGYHFEGMQYSIGKYNLGDTPIHGLLYNLPFTVIEQACYNNMAMISLQCDYLGDDPGFPFGYTMVVTYTLQAKNRVSIHTQVHNSSGVPMPISDGWHPYFSLGAPVDALELTIDAQALVEFDEALLPTGNLLPNTTFEQATSLQKIALDNCFLLNKPLLGAACTLANPATGLVLRIFPDASYPYLQVYTPPHRQSIAIENLSSAPNAFNNGMGLMVLEADETVAFTTTYALETV